MGTTGLIFGAIVVAWLAYLVPLFLKHHKVEQADGEEHRPFSHAVRQLVGARPDIDHDKPAEVSTPLTRRAALAQLRSLDAMAARRRRTVLTVLFAALSVVLGTSAAGLTPWWSLAIPGVLVVAFLVTARFSVVAMRRDLDARRERILAGESDESEDTVTVGAEELEQVRRSAAETAALGPVTDQGSKLWDPLPITAPTYVSKPLAARTIRTIDLGAPGVSSSARGQGVPPTAEEPTIDVAGGGGSTALYDPERKRAVGE